MRAAVLRYRVMAYITGVVLIILCFVGIPLQVIDNNTVIVNDVGTLHGCLYIIYIIVAYLLTRRLRLAIGPTVLVLLAGTIPVLTFVVERWLSHKYIDPALAAAAQPARQDRSPRLRRRGRPPVNRVGQHYFTEDPAAAHRPGLVQVVLGDRHFECATDAGVFSASRLDPGTRVLLDTAPPPPPAGQLLDLGTGYGPIALAMAARAPGATVWAVDVNTRALELCAGNAARAGLGNVRCVPPDDPALPATFGGDLVEPAHPDRQGGAAPPAGRLARPPGARAAAPTWWCSATWAPTRCTAGSVSRAGRRRGSRPGPATGCWR